MSGGIELSSQWERGSLGKRGLMVNRTKLRVGAGTSHSLPNPIPRCNRTLSISATYLGFNPLWKCNLLTSWIQVVSKNSTGVDGASKGFSQHMSRKVLV